MNEHQNEITKLHEQISQLYVLVKRLSEYVGWEDIRNLSKPLDPISMVNISPSSHYRNDHHNGNGSNSLQISDEVPDNMYLLNQHKDILVDDESVHASVTDNNQNMEMISCEEQVHRLTAQLTAAYYRIASLEEQLLSLRNNLETGDSSFYQCQ